MPQRFAQAATFMACVLFSCAVGLARAQYTHDTPPPYYNAPQVYWVTPEQQDRAQRLAEKARLMEQRLQRRRAIEQLTAQHRSRNRLFTYLGFEPVLVARSYPGSERRGRFRHQAFTLGAAYRHHFRPRVGLHVGGSFGVGASRIGLAMTPGSESSVPSSKRVAASYSLNAEVAPLFGPFGRAFYIAPAWVTRVIFAPAHRAVLTADDAGEPATHLVSFQSPLVTTSARLVFGFMLGRHDEFDLNVGFDVGYAARDARQSIGMFVRLGAAFGDLARD